MIISGEFITEVQQGYPMLVRSIDSSFNLANVMKTHIYSAFSTLKIGIDLLKRMKILKLIQYMDTEVYSKPKSCSNILAAAMQSPVSVMQTASEGGAWGLLF